MMMEVVLVSEDETKLQAAADALFTHQLLGSSPTHPADCQALVFKVPPKDTVAPHCNALPSAPRGCRWNIVHTCVPHVLTPTWLSSACCQSYPQEHHTDCQDLDETSVVRFMTSTRSIQRKTIQRDLNPTKVLPESNKNISNKSIFQRDHQVRSANIFFQDQNLLKTFLKCTKANLKW